MKELELELEQILKWLVDDIALPQPTLVSTIFSTKELATAMKVDWQEALWQQLFTQLTEMQIISPTNKAGPDGTYYNLHLQVINKIRPNRTDRFFVNGLIAREEGFCVVYGDKRVYRLQCEGRNCKFYFATEKKCVKEKFFLK